MTRERKEGLRRGQVVVLFASFLIVLVGICILAIDVGRLFVCRAQLQNAVDAAALAGASQLLGWASEDEKTDARLEAKAIAVANIVAGVPLTLTDDDIQFGHYDGETATFVPEPQASVVDSIRISGRRTHDSPDGPIGLFFGPVFGWHEQEFTNVVAVGTKPRRFVMFVLDRSGSMCFDTEGVEERFSAEEDGEGFYMAQSPSGWYWFPEDVLIPWFFWNIRETAYFYARDMSSGQIVTDFLPDHIKDRLDDGIYFRFRQPDNPTYTLSGWLKVPSGVRVYCRQDTGNWDADDYYWVVDDCDYAISSDPVQPLQATMDAACAFVDLLREGDDHAGLVTYASGSITDSILTADFAALEEQLQKFVPSGSTAEPEGMQDGFDELIDSGRADGFGQRIAILLTDGNANTLYGDYYADDDTHTYEFLGETVTTQIHPVVGAAMETQANRARNNGVRVYCVTFGTDVDTEVHRQIARATDAAYYYAADHDSLTDVFVDIFRRLPPIITQ
jgi:hypothetical protein